MCMVRGRLCLVLTTILALTMLTHLGFIVLLIDQQVAAHGLLHRPLVGHFGVGQGQEVGRQSRDVRHIYRSIAEPITTSPANLTLVDPSSPTFPNIRLVTPTLPNGSKTVKPDHAINLIQRSSPKYNTSGVVNSTLLVTMRTVLQKPKAKGNDLMFTSSGFKSTATDEIIGRKVGHLDLNSSLAMERRNKRLIQQFKMTAQQVKLPPHKAKSPTLHLRPQGATLSHRPSAQTLLPQRNATLSQKQTASNSTVRATKKATLFSKHAKGINGQKQGVKRVNKVTPISKPTRNPTYGTRSKNTLTKVLKMEINPASKFLALARKPGTAKTDPPIKPHNASSKLVPNQGPSKGVKKTSILHAPKSKKAPLPTGETPHKTLQQALRPAHVEEYNIEADNDIWDAKDDMLDAHLIPHKTTTTTKKPRVKTQRRDITGDVTKQTKPATIKTIVKRPKLAATKIPHSLTRQ